MNDWKEWYFGRKACLWERRSLDPASLVWWIYWEGFSEAIARITMFEIMGSRSKWCGGLCLKGRARVWKDRVVFKMTGSLSKRRARVSKGRARIWKDRVVLERMRLCLKGQAHVWKDVLAFERAGLRLKGRARVWNDGVVFETMGSRSKRLSCVRNDGLAFERTGLCSKRRGCISKGQARVRNDAVVFRKDGFALEMLLLC